jgi:tRNA (guanine37-N1)-methyltransferase
LQLVHGGERIVVIGAGVGPFAIEIAKKHHDVEVIGIEPNRYAYDAMLDNVKINKTPNVKAVLGKAEKVCMEYSSYADRIIVPMPTTSLEFLDMIARVARKTAVVHLYVFGGIDNVLKDTLKKIKINAKANEYSTKLLNHRIVRPYSAKEAELVVDFRINKK